MIKELLKWWRGNEFTITDTVLPDFPSYTVPDEVIWRILDSNKKLTKKLGMTPSKAFKQRLFTCHTKIDKRRDSECYPTWSPITLHIVIKDKR